jgi:hypothetical protein
MRVDLVSVYYEPPMLIHDIKHVYLPEWMLLHRHTICNLARLKRRNYGGSRFRYSFRLLSLGVGMVS